MCPLRCSSKEAAQPFQPDASQGPAAETDVKVEKPLGKSKCFIATLFWNWKLNLRQFKQIEVEIHLLESGQSQHRKRRRGIGYGMRAENDAAKSS